MVLMLDEPEAKILALNKSWHRDFEVDLKLESQGKQFFLCRFKEPDRGPGSLPEAPFLFFGAFHVKGTDITEAWPMLDKKPSIVDVIVRAAKEFGDHECRRCMKYVNWQDRKRFFGNLIEIMVHCCPACGFEWSA